MSAPSVSSVPLSAEPAAAAARAGWKVPLLVVGLVLAVATAVLGPWPVGAFWDDGIYVILARSLAEGHGYRYLNLPGHPVATHFPPGYPLFLAALWKLGGGFPQNAALLRFANAVLHALAALGLYVFARRRLRVSERAAGALAVLAMVAVPALFFTSQLLSEPLFLALLLPVLVLAERACEAPATRRFVELAVMIALLMYVRSIAITLLGAVLLLLAHRRRWRGAAIVAAATGALVLPWALFVSAHQGDLPEALRGQYGSYSGWLVDGVRAGGPAFVVAVVRSNVAALWGMALSMLARPEAGVPPARVAIVVLTLSLLAVGATRFRRHAPVTTLFLALYVSLVLVWPFSPIRFVLTLWPLIVLLFVLGAAAAWRWLGEARGVPHARVRLAASALLLLGAAAALAGQLYFSVRGFAEGWYAGFQPEAAKAAVPAIRWINEHSSPADVVMSDADPMVYLYTGRLSIPAGRFLPQEVLTGIDATAAQQMRDVLRTARVRYVLALPGPATPAAVALLRASPPELQLVDTLPGGSAVLSPIYR